MKLQTNISKQIWQSPDGNRTIWEVMGALDGQPVTTKTYSSKIASLASRERSRNT
jgi:hypothetical protein